MIPSQPGILVPVPAHACSLEFGLRPDGDPRPVLAALARRPLGGERVVGLGPGLLESLGRPLEGLHAFPAISGAGCTVVSTQADLWCWVRGDDRGTILHQARAVEESLKGAFHCLRRVDTFRHGAGLDLTGYEDGTENPADEAAVTAAIVQGQGPGLDGSSLAALQQWRHDLDFFERLSREDQDHIIGRRRSDNEEIEDAPPTAHVKRTAQESFQPAAFIVRRSMPWADAGGEGLLFLAFGHSLYAFEAMLRRMTGQEDRIVDALFRISRPVTGSCFWCPPVTPGGTLDLSACGL
ncbi:MAG: Dyp-type peroxidase [Magnetococcales bacterium]|nr:Dyp-type peroxidase [Magnetococcales bacterium]